MSWDEFLERLRELKDAGIDIDKLPNDLTLGDVMRIPIPRLKQIADANKADHMERLLGDAHS